MKKLIALSIVIIVVMSFNSIIYAAHLTNGIEIGTPSPEITDAGNEIFGLVKVAGTICSVAALMLIGIKYMLASTEEKAEYKRTFWVYIVGAILVFAIANLTDIVYEFVSNIA